MLTIEPPACGRHRPVHCLDSEEVVAQIDGDSVVKVLRSHLVNRVPLVVGGVVDEHGDRSVGPDRPFDAGLERRDVPQVAVLVARRRQSAGPDSCDQRSSSRIVDVDEADLRALLAELFGDRAADTRGTARDEDHPIPQTGIDRLLALVHRDSPRTRIRTPPCRHDRTVGETTCARQAPPAPAGADCVLSRDSLRPRVATAVRATFAGARDGRSTRTSTLCRLGRAVHAAMRTKRAGAEAARRWRLTG